jgi:hypothetical protein
MLKKLEGYITAHETAKTMEGRTFEERTALAVDTVGSLAVALETVRQM